MFEAFFFASFCKQKHVYVLLFLQDQLSLQIDKLDIKHFAQQRKKKDYEHIVVTFPVFVFPTAVTWCFNS